MTGLELGLLQFGVGAAQSLFGHSQAQKQAKLANKQAKEAAAFDLMQRQQMQNWQHRQALKAYGLRVEAHEAGVKSRDEMLAMSMTQEQLRMNELMRGMKFADQDASIALAQSQGRIQAGMQQGRTAGRRMALDSAAVMRNQAKREQRMLGELLASNLRGEARIKQVNAQNLASWQQVRFVPEKGPAPMMAPVAKVQGPGWGSLLSGLGGAAMAGVSAGIAQGNYRNSLKANNPAKVPVPQIA